MSPATTALPTAAATRKRPASANMPSTTSILMSWDGGGCLATSTTIGDCCRNKITAAPWKSVLQALRAPAPTLERELDQCSHGYARRALRLVRLGILGPGRSRDIEVRPGQTTREFLDE